MRVLVLLVALAAIVHCSLPVKHKPFFGFKADRASHEVSFQVWMEKFNKTYATDAEHETRITNFIETKARVMKRLLETKRVGASTQWGLTKFADLTPEEFGKLLRTKLPKTRLAAPVAALPKAAPPASWDWRDHNGITGQKNEQQCGSCWAMTVAMAIESAYMIHKQKTQVPLSTQQILDCDTADQGCNGGDPTTAYQYVVQAGGLESEADYPYLGQDGTCHAVKNLEQDPITGYQLAIPQGSTDETALANFLATNQPISTAVDASSWQDYTGGILMASQCSQNIDHGVQIVGYNLLSSTGYWTIRNMWGADWGENGFIRLQFGQNTCGLTSLPTAPTL